MAESYSVKAVLSAKDAGFTSTLKGAIGTVKSLGSQIKNGLVFGALAGAGSQAFSAITSSVKGLASEAINSSDAMQKLQQAMRFGGTPEAEIQRIAGATGTLKTYADKTVFSLDDVLSTFGALSANGIKDADKMTEAVGNAVAVFGGGANEFASVGLAYSQAMAAGALHAQDWNQILNASPQLAGGLRKELQKLNPELAEDFKGAMEKGKISADLLGQAMNNIGMTDFAKNAAESCSTFEGAMGNLEATVSSGVMDIYNSFAKSGVVGVINNMNSKIGKGFEWLSAAIPKAIKKVQPYLYVFKKNFGEIKAAVAPAVSAVSASFSKLDSSFGSIESMMKLDNALKIVTNTIVKFAGFCEKHSDGVAKFISLLPKMILAIKGFKIAKAVAPGILSLGKGIGTLAGKATKGLAGKLFGIGKAQEDVGKKSSVSGKKMLTSAKSFALMGVAVLAVAIGFGILAYSAIQLANNGGAAIGVMAGLTLGLVGMMLGMVMVLKVLAPMSKKLIPVGVAMLALGGAVFLVAAGFAIMAMTAIKLSEAGNVAIGVFLGLFVAIGVLMGVAAALGPALTAGTAGFLAFGASILMVGVGALLAAMALYIVANVLPVVTQYGSQAAEIISILGVSLLDFGAGALVAGVGAIVLGAGLAVVGIGLALVGTALLIVSAAVLVLSAGLLLSAAALSIFAAILPRISAYGEKAGTALLALAEGVLALGVASLSSVVGLTGFGLATAASALGCTALALALAVVNSNMKSIAKNAKTTENSLKGMESSVNLVGRGLDALGNKAKSAMNKLTSAFDNAASKAQSAGQKVGTGFTNGMQTGLSRAPSVAMMVVASVNSALASGSAMAFNSGAFISIGFANGMLSQLATVRAAAAQLAQAADEAVRAKAKIGSPSRVAAKLGGYWDEGLANGIADNARKVWNAAQSLVSVPTMTSPKLAYAYSGETVSDYEYYRNSEYTIVVKSELDGREVGRGTAKYTQEQIDRMQTRERRKKGKV